MKLQLIAPINEAYSPIEQVLTNRGIKLEDIPNYLNLTEKNNLNPKLLDNVDKAIEMLLNHISMQDNEILVIVDCDCDGFCSSALLLNYIYKAFPSAIDKFKYALHSDKSHGIIADAITASTTLVIAPDASSNEFELHETLAKRNIDVLVIDHHHADKVSEYACVVNNQLCDYPNKTLSGGGVVYKVLQRIDELAHTDYAKELLDLVCVALVGDMMDLRNMETRYLVQEGMQHFRNPFLSAMREKNAFSIGSELTPIGIAFYIVPFINAMTRSGDMNEKKLLFQSMLEWEANKIIPSTKRGCKGQMERLVEQACRVCTNVKNRQTRNRDADMELIEKRIKDQDLLSRKILLVKADGLNLNRAIVGLMANELMSKYQHPTTILSPVHKEDGLYWEGSARGLSQSALEDFRKFCEDSKLVAMAQGHGNAFGLSISDKNLEDFLNYSDEALRDIEFTPTYKVDFLYSANAVNTKTILDLGECKALWGQEVSAPLIAVKNISVTKDMITLMSKDKNPTLKIQLSNGVSCIKFRSSQKEYESLLSDSGCVNITLVGKPEVNRYCGSITPQLIITDYEVLSKQDFYF